MAQATQLIKAYMTETIPPDGGFIVTAFFMPGNYSIYEITAYRNVKDIFRSNDGITFKTDGNRTHLLIEPAIFTKKYIEPVNREGGFAIPYRFAELDITTTSKSEKLMVGIEPLMLYSSFTILEKQGDYFSFIFHPTSDVYVAMRKFIADSLYNDCGLSTADSKNTAAKVLETIKKFTIFKG
ncbi:MAG: hypothetical protein GXY14_14430 [Spirochaetes bacterium]|nr:hypothetical protein [Spirochaetota bacterium]